MRTKFISMQDGSSDSQSLMYSDLCGFVFESRKTTFFRVLRHDHTKKLETGLCSTFRYSLQYFSDTFGNSNRPWRSKYMFNQWIPVVRSFIPLSLRTTLPREFFHTAVATHNPAKIRFPPLVKPKPEKVSREEQISPWGFYFFGRRFLQQLCTARRTK